MSLMAEWCAWCEKLLRGKESFEKGLCYVCRNSKEGKESFKKAMEDLKLKH